MNKLLQAISPDLPALRFRAQQVDGSIRPDLWGYQVDEPRAFIENKFWAGLTENQPVSYLNRLEATVQPSILLVVAPAKRERTLWRDLRRRLEAGGIAYSQREPVAGVRKVAATRLGPILAMASWSVVLSALDQECLDDAAARHDLSQLRDLCQAMDEGAPLPLSVEELGDQRIPGLIAQLGGIVQSATDLGLRYGVLSVDGLRPQASWERIGRYVRLVGSEGPGVWFGIHFDYWHRFGYSPLWAVFSRSPFGRADEVHPLLEPWATASDSIVVSSD